MALATVYGVVQLLALASPTRTVRTSTVLLAVLVGAYACGLAAVILEYSYTRVIADQPRGRALREAVSVTSYTISPTIEEILKIAPILLTVRNKHVRRQWGFTDYVLIGGASGAGFGLIEALGRLSPEVDQAVAHTAGGWVVPSSLTPPYIPGLSQIVHTWFPAPFGTLGIGGSDPTTPTSPHLAFSTTAALGLGLAIRNRGWARLWGCAPFSLACALHTLFNYSAEHRHSASAKELLANANNILWVIPLACLGISIVMDMIHIRKAKRSAPEILTHSERAGRTGLEALGGYGLWRFPWSMAISLRFARARRSLLYALCSDQQK
uniref:PrsW family glutamic-type intramembrane protease n=1 Tax=Streptomyces sp. HSW2009 TaxID=3142890 RepID=UPI0032EE318A